MSSGYLLDSTVMVDAQRGRAVTAAWLRSVPQTRLHICTISIAELFRGAFIESLRNSERGVHGMAFIHEQTIPNYRGRILDFDLPAAKVWGRLIAQGAARGRTPPSDDAKIAAIALVHDLVMASSNVRDMSPLCRVFNPRTGITHAPLA